MTDPADSAAMRIRQLSMSARAGSAEAYYQLARCYSHQGNGVRVSRKKAFEYFQEAAIRNHSGAQDWLGRCYQHGWGVAASPDLAFYWYSQAEKQNLPNARFHLGVCYLKGIGTHVAKNRAVALLRQAAEAGQENALSLLRRLNVSVPPNPAGSGFQIDFPKLTAAAKFGQGESFLFRGNFLGALEWYREAARDHYPQALRRLGDCYYKGWGATQNTERARSYWTQAYERGDDLAGEQLKLLKNDGSVPISGGPKITDRPGAVPPTEEDGTGIPHGSPAGGTDGETPPEPPIIPEPFMRRLWIEAREGSSESLFRFIQCYRGSAVSIQRQAAEVLHLETERFRAAAENILRPDVPDEKKADHWKYIEHMVDLFSQVGGKQGLIAICMDAGRRCETEAKTPQHYEYALRWYSQAIMLGSEAAQMAYNRIEKHLPPAVTPPRPKTPVRPILFPPKPTPTPSDTEKLLDLLAENNRMIVDLTVRLCTHEAADAPIRVGSFAGLARIHAGIFPDRSDTGRLRTENLVEDGVRFVPPMYLREAVAAVEKMPETTFDSVIRKFIEMYAIHPFAFGNDEALAEWVNGMLREAGYLILWGLVADINSDCRTVIRNSPQNPEALIELLSSAVIEA